MDKDNKNVVTSEYNDLEDIVLPPLSSTSFFEPTTNYINDELTPLPEDDDMLKICVDEELNMKNELSAFNKEHSIYKKDITLSEEIIKKEVESKVEFYHTCCSCKRYVSMRNMFTLDYKNPSLLDKLICIECSSQISESYLLHDWSSDIECNEMYHCPRCKKDKPSYKFKNNNKYCDYCLIKKKWLRLRSKIQKEDIYSDFEENSGSSSNNSSGDDSDKIGDSNHIRKVICFNCNISVNIKQTFLYYKVKDYFSKKYICLNCSLGVSNCHLLHDWEDNVSLFDGKMCNRCKKIKSFNRFKTGHSGCDYCSLKRKRLYLLTRK